MSGGTAPLLLLSMPQMADPNFAQAVILLCDYTDQGAFGIVVNRQMDEPAWTMVKTVGARFNRNRRRAVNMNASRQASGSPERQYAPRTPPGGE